MKRLEEIQDELAQLNGYNQLYEISYIPLLESLINESIKKYTTECIKASLYKASENREIFDDDGYFFQYVKPESIKSEENILIL